MFEFLFSFVRKLINIINDHVVLYKSEILVCESRYVIHQSKKKIENIFVLLICVLCKKVDYTSATIANVIRETIQLKDVAKNATLLHRGTFYTSTYDQTIHDLCK